MVWYIIGIVLFFGLFSGFFFLWRIPQIIISDSRSQIPPISIIIPARNEEKSLPHLLKSLTQQTMRPLEIIVVDDESSDKTAEIAEAFGATVISSKTEKNTPKGKSAACWAGAKRANGDWLIFLDSDTYFVRKDALQSIASSYLKKNEKGLFSIQPYHETEKIYETFSVVLNIMVMAGLNRFSLLKDKLPERGAFGPFLLTTQNQYEQAGGHNAILDTHMDDIELARLFKEKGWPVYVYGGAGSIHFRMFPEGVKQLVNGWTKSLIHGSKGTHPYVYLSIGLWITGVFLVSFLLIQAIILVESITIFLSLLTYIVYCVQFRWLMNKVGRFPQWTMCMPVVYLIVFLVLYIWAFVQVTILKKVKWRDREIRT